MKEENRWYLVRDNHIIDNNFSFFKPNDIIFGRTFSEWTGLWWKSFYLDDKERNKQNVFMVPGRITEIDGGSKDFYRRRNFVLRQIPILIPIVNWFSPGVDPHAQAEAKERIDVVSTDSFDVRIDGKQVKQFVCRVANSYVELTGKLRKLYGFVRGKGLATSDGYWLFIKQLPIGEYNVHTFGMCSSGMTRLDMEYDLTIQ